MKVIRLIVMSFALLHCGASAVRSRNETIVLPKIVVMADLLVFEYGGQGDIIKWARVKEVTPGSSADKGGILAGDLIFSINGKEVIGMNKQDFELWASSPVAPGYPKEGNFIGKRGFLKKNRVSITLTLSIPPAAK